MAINKKTVCNSCTAEFFIEPLEDFPIDYCPSCGAKIYEEEEFEESDDE